MNNTQRKGLRVLKNKIKALKDCPRTDRRSKRTLFNVKLELENMVLDEEMKINNLPDNLYFSRLAERLEESLEKIEDVKCEVAGIDAAKSKEEYLSSIDKAITSFDAILY